MTNHTRLNVKQIYKILKKYQKYTLFSLALDRIENLNIPMARYIKHLIDTNHLYLNMDDFFGSSPTQASQVKLHDAVHKIPEYGSFLQKYNFPHDEWLNPSHFVHDVIGHILFHNSVSGHGELKACSGVMGFCPSTGNDYFICALLIFSLGIALFSDVKPQNIHIDSDLAKQMSDMYTLGENFRKYIDFTSESKYKTMYFILDEWENIKMYLKEMPNDK